MGNLWERKLCDAAASNKFAKKPTHKPWNLHPSKSSPLYWSVSVLHTCTVHSSIIITHILHVCISIAQTVSGCWILSCNTSPLPPPLPPSPSPNTSELLPPLCPSVWKVQLSCCVLANAAKLKCIYTSIWRILNWRALISWAVGT